MNEMLERHAREAAARKEARIKGLLDMNAKDPGKKLDIFSEEFRSNNNSGNKQPKEILEVPGAPLLTCSLPPRYMIDSIPFLRLPPTGLLPDGTIAPVLLERVYRENGIYMMSSSCPAAVDSPSIKRYSSKIKRDKKKKLTNLDINLDALVEECGSPYLSPFSLDEGSLNEDSDVFEMEQND